MPRPVPDINYVLAGPSRHDFDQATMVDTITVPYAVGNKASDGTVKIYNIAGMPSPLANGSFVVYEAPVTDTRPQTVTNILQMIRVQEELDETDTIDLT